MKKIPLLVCSLSLIALLLSGCSNNCECDCSDMITEKEPVISENTALDQSTQDCLDKGGTHSLIHSNTAVYGECSFPSGITCEDGALADGSCQYEIDLSNIDTEEKRIAGCEESVGNRIRDIENGELLDIDWETETGEGTSIIRKGSVKYSKGGDNRKIVLECISDFVDGSITVMNTDSD